MFNISPSSYSARTAPWMQNIRPVRTKLPRSCKLWHRMHTYTSCQTVWTCHWVQCSRMVRVRRPKVPMRFRLRFSAARAIRTRMGFLLFRTKTNTEFKKRRAKRKIKPLKNQTPWQEISRLIVGQLEDGACIKTRSIYTNIIEKKGSLRHSH